MIPWVITKCNELSLIIIMIISGIFGGFARYMLDKERNKWRFEDVLKAIILAVFSVFLVPLFLNLISSDLCSQTHGDLSKLLIYIGFCLIAAFFSKSFIYFVSKSAIKEIEKLEKNMKSLKSSVSNVQENVLLLEANNSDINTSVNNTQDSILLNENQLHIFINNYDIKKQKVLLSFKNRPKNRNMKNIYSDLLNTNIKLDGINELKTILIELEKDKIVTKPFMEDNDEYWCLSTFGIKLIQLIKEDI